MDLRTVVIMSALLAGLLSLLMLLVRFGRPSSVKGLTCWALAPLLQGLAGFLFAARGVVPDLASIILANGLLLGGTLLFYVGTRRFFGLRVTYGAWLAALAVTLLLLTWLTVAAPNFNLRVIVVCVFWLSMLLMNMLTVWRYGPEQPATLFIVILLLVHAVVIVARLLAALVPFPHESLFKPTHVQTVYFVAHALVLVAYVFGLLLMLTERVREELERHASSDELTGAMTRRALIAAAAQELDRCRRHRRSMVLMMIDLDHFKDVNDTYGHQMGDRVLVDFVQRVRPLLRRHDQLGRLGGEEFVILLPEASIADARMVAERIRARMGMPSDDLPFVTVSIGLTANRSDDLAVDMLLARADQALYRAKAEGRDRVVEA